MRSHEQGGMPHLIPQKTNVLTGAATKYFANQPSSWKQDYSDLVQFQKARANRLGEIESAAPRGNVYNGPNDSQRSGKPRLHPITGKSVDDLGGAKVSMPLRGTGINIASQLTEMHERRERMEMMNYQQKMVS